MCAARARAMYDRQAKERQSKGGQEAGRCRPKQVMENLPQPIAGTARDQAARVFGVSGKSVDYAGKVLTQARR